MCEAGSLGIRNWMQQRDGKHESRKGVQAASAERERESRSWLNLEPGVTCTPVVAV